MPEAPDLTRELLPCPFCGSSDIDPEYTFHGKENEDVMEPGCRNCGATAGNWNNRSPDFDCGFKRAMNIAASHSSLVAALGAMERELRTPGLRAAALRASEARAQWIPVSERLPDPRTMVLAYEDDGQMRVSFFIDTSFCGPHATTVTHWMPMPEPPMIDAAIRALDR